MLFYGRNRGGHTTDPGQFGRTSMVEGGTLAKDGNNALAYPREDVGPLGGRLSP